MSKLIILVTSLFIHLAVNAQTLISEDFESFPANTNIPIAPAATTYQNNNNSASCSVNDGWRIWSANAAGTTCNSCSGQRGIIDYNISCTQNATLITQSFSSNIGTINISFDYAYRYEDGTDETFVADLYNETDGIIEANLVTLTTTSQNNGLYNNTQSVTIGKNYSLRFRYEGDFDWGATVDNILVEDLCAPSATFTQICSSNLNYSVTVDITSLNGGTSAIISDGGANTYYTNVGIGTYSVNGLNSAQSVYVTNDLGCDVSQLFSICDPCNTTSTPSDLPCNAPSVDLTQPFYGSTACGYTVTSGGTKNGPDAFCGSANNDSWLSFVASNDTVQLDWTVIYDNSNPSGGPCNQGVQFAILDGNCGNEDAMVELGCFNPNPAIFQATGSFIIPDPASSTPPLTIGDEYFIYIDGYAGDLCDYFWQAQQGVAITPENDSCENAIVMTCGDIDTSNNILATGNDAPLSCGGLNTGVGVWYEFIGNGSSVTISTDHPITNFDTEIFVYEGPCTNLTCIGADNNSGNGTSSEFTFTSNAGISYLIYVDGNGSSIGEFGITFTCQSCDADAGIWD